MVTLTNSFHGTTIEIRKNVGDAVSHTTLRRARKHLCGIPECTCGGDDGTRESRYQLEVQGFGSDAKILVVDSRGA